LVREPAGFPRVERKKGKTKEKKTHFGGREGKGEIVLFTPRGRREKKKRRKKRGGKAHEWQEKKEAVSFFIAVPAERKKGKRKRHTSAGRKERGGETTPRGRKVRE